MRKQSLRQGLEKAVLCALAIIMATGIMFFGGESSVAYAEEETYYITEPQSGLNITNNMVAPKPTTEGKETYIFAGYFSDRTCETPVVESTEATVYKKFVPADIMSVKAQVTEGTRSDTNKTDMRLVTTVDSLDYQEVGFDVYFNGAKTPVNAKSTTVYKRILAADKGNSFGYSPESFSVDADYFTTVNLVNIANKNFDKTFFIKPYWKTLDGTKVYGMSRMARVSDSYNHIVNVPVRMYTNDLIETGSFALSYDTDILTYVGNDNGDLFDSVTVAADVANAQVNVTTTATIENPDGMVVNLRFKVNEGATLETITIFEIESETFTSAQIANVVYKNFSSTYSGNPDTSWYEEFKLGNTFCITTPADFYGLAKLVNDGTDTFEQDTIYLGADIVINKAILDPDAPEWSTVSAACVQWTPIGTTNAFAGTFDGQGHTISGVYLTSKDTNKTYGLFGTTADGSTLRDFRLENSYFELFNVNGKTPLGSVVGNFNGTLKEVFSDAVVVSTRGKLGGIVGDVDQNPDVVSNIESCWYDGRVILNATDIATRHYEEVGGMVGGVNQGTLNVNNCVSTSNVICTYGSYAASGNKAIAGVVGYIYTGTTVTATNIIMAGNITVRCGNVTDGYTTLTGEDKNTDYSGRGVALYLGYGNGTQTLTNAYCIGSNDYAYIRSTVTAKNYENTLTADTLTGHLGYKHTTALGYYDAESNPSGNWVVRATSADLSEGVPVPKCFADNDTIDVTWYYGTENYSVGNNRFTIDSAEELYGFADIASTYNFENDIVELGADIVANVGNASTWSSTTKTTRNWMPIGTVDTPFAGEFKGNEHTISGIYLVGSDTSKTYGLFGTTADGSVLRDFRLENSHFELTGITAQTSMGSVAGVLNGDLENVYSDAKVVSVLGKIGGLVGSVNQASSEDTNHITNCWHNGKIELNKNAAVANYECVGGVVGLVNRGNLQITNCLKTGEVECTFKPATSGTNNKAIGGLVGRVMSNGSLSICDTVMAASILGQHKNGEQYIKWTGYEDNLSGKGISLSVGYGSVTLIDVYCRNSNGYAVYRTAETGSSNYTQRFTQSELNGHVAYSNTQGLNYYHPDTNPTGAWVIREKASNVADGCPVPKIFANEWIDVAWYYDNVTKATDEVPSPADTYTISTPEEMYGLSVISTIDSFENDTISLANDIEMNTGSVNDWKKDQINNVRIWTPIGTNDNGYAFAGTFDGGMHTISGVYVETEQQGAGLFGTTAQGSNIQNLRLVNSYINSEYGDSTYGCVGSIVGSCAGSLENIYSDAYVASTSSASGGLVGELWSNQDVAVEQCWFDGEMNVVANSGGLIGMYSATGCTLTMRNCLNSGTINYNNKNFIGGLIGRTLPSTSRWGTDTNGSQSIINMANCLNYGQLSPNPNNKSAAGSILGQLEKCELTLTLVYATNESYVDSTTSTSKYLGNKKGSVLNGEAILDDKEKFEGLEVTSETFSPLSTDEWVITSEMPVPSVFADYVATIDVSWYETGVGGTINTRAQLWGLSYLSQKQSIDGTITLGSDIDLNPGWTASENVTTPEVVWKPVGTVKYPFLGTFNGNGHTIRGMYIEESQQYIGFFGHTKIGSEITDFRIENSYVYNLTSHYTGSVVGKLCGNLSKVYSNAIVKSEQSRLGGLVAYVEPISATDEQIQITDCWYDGKIIGSSRGQYLGGVVSTIRYGTCNMSNILFTGEIESDYQGTSHAYIGGIVAYVGHTEQNTILKLESVVSAGTIISRWKPNYVHAVVSYVLQYNDNIEPQLILNNVFATRDCAETVTGGNAEKSGVVARTTGADRLIGISSYEDKNPDGKTTCHLDFSEWSMRVDDVPIPTCFSDISKVKDSVIVNYEPESLAKEIGLDYWNTAAQITDTTFYGAGNYVISYNATEEQYNNYIAKLAELEFSEKITNSVTDMSADGVYASTYCKDATAESGEWVLNLTYVKNKSTIYISINTDVESIAQTLEEDNDLANSTESEEEAISLSMLEIMTNDNNESNGNSFVFQLPNKHFIVVDGGREEDGANLVAYMREQVGKGQDVVIDAWFITHYHADHSGVLKAFYENSSLRENVYLEAIYACEPSSYALNWKEDDQQLTGANEALRGAKTLTKKSDGSKPDVYQLHMGQRYYFYGMTMDVIDTQEQRHVTQWGSLAPDDFNASSTNCVFTFEDTNNDVKKVLIGGDATNTNLQYIIKAYGEGNQTLSDIDVFVAYHHGLNTTIEYSIFGNNKATSEWINFLLNNNGGRFDVVFFPYYKVYQNNDSDRPSSVYPSDIGNINEKLYNNSDAYFTYGYDDCLEEYDNENRHGTVKVTFDGNNTATIYRSGVFTTAAE